MNRKWKTIRTKGADFNRIINSVTQKVDFLEGYKIGQELRKSIMYHPNVRNCVGLAYNQIGGDKSVCIIKQHREKVLLHGKWRILINPEITRISRDTFKSKESCMSFPSKESTIDRFPWIMVKHLTENGYKEEEFADREATIIQHEIDHLNGIHIMSKSDKHRKLYNKHNRRLFYTGRLNSGGR